MLTLIRRREAPLDGSWFRTTGRLNSILRAAVLYDDDKSQWPSWVNDTVVPLFVRMALYKAQKTKLHPDGMIYGPIVRVGSMASPEVKLCGFHHAAGLIKDYNLYEFGSADCPAEEPWLYTVRDEDTEAPGKNADCYICSECGEWLYRDEQGRRQGRSATLYDGALVCRSCDVHGLVLDGPAQDQLDRCRRLSDYLAKNYDYDPVRSLERQIVFHSNKTSWGDKPCQVRAWKCDTFSFDWSEFTFTPEGKKRGLVGGLIQHGPTPKEQPDGSWTFKTWDYQKNEPRAATPEEICHICWSNHT